jgi:uncharacterized protein involved in exopolysaccharide biosynthesis
MDRIVALAPLWKRVMAWRLPILVLALSASGLVGAIAFILPPWYSAQTELLPPREDESGLGAASLLRGIGVPGLRIPTEVSPADVFMVVLQSRRISEEVIKKFDLMRLYKQKYMVDAVQELQRHVRFRLTEAGTIRISVEDKDRRRAADMANAYVEFLDRFNREVRMTKGRRTRLFVETRLTETKSELAAAEQRLAEYQTKNKTVALSPQMSSAVDEAAKLSARRMALEVRLGVLRGYSKGSDEEVQIRQELTELDRQMSNLPVTGLEQVFAILTAQYEDARITEARDVMTVEVLDVAIPPERKARPKRLVMIGSAFLLSLALGTGLALLFDERRAGNATRAAVG